MIGTGASATTRPKAATAEASGRLTRTSSQPASTRARTCASVASASPVSVQVIDCTRTGASPPIVTPPTSIRRVRRRSIAVTTGAAPVSAAASGLPVPRFSSLVVLILASA